MPALSLGFLKFYPLEPRLNKEEGKSLRNRFLAFIVSLLLWAGPVLGHSANMVWFEFMDDGRYKVVIGYTVPELKEFRESYVIFRSKSEAESFYWDLVQGADFYPSHPQSIRFSAPKHKPTPW